MEKSSALNELYESYAHELFLYALILTKNKVDAENLVSDTFFKLLMQDCLPKEPKFWLYRVLKNQFLDNQRQKKRWRWQQYETLHLSDEEELGVALLQQEKYHKLYQAVESLDYPYREAIVLFYFSNWSVKEIAEFLAMKSGQVRTILYRGRKKLKEAMEDGEDLA